MSESSPVPAWYGKLPTLGDFASRRLDADFVEMWDAWLAQGLLNLQTRVGNTWLDAYLVAPSWRFVLMPGALPGRWSAEAWAGVLMPSVDRVGRYFPLTLICSLGELPASTQQLDGVWQWLGRLDDLAADALHDDWSVEQLEQELGRMAPAPVHAWPPVQMQPVTQSGACSPVALPPGMNAAHYTGATAYAQWRSQNHAQCFWYTASEEAPQRCYQSNGLPRDASCLLGLT